jgi:hypothetical protein
MGAGHVYSKVSVDALTAICEFKLCSHCLRIASVSALSLAIEELDDLLFNGNDPPSKPTGKEYDRTTYSTYASNPKAAFQKLYMFSFNLVKPEYVCSWM